MGGRDSLIYRNQKKKILVIFLFRVFVVGTSTQAAVFLQEAVPAVPGCSGTRGNLINQHRHQTVECDQDQMIRRNTQGKTSPQTLQNTLASRRKRNTKQEYHLKSTYKSDRQNSQMGQHSGKHPKEAKKESKKKNISTIFLY